MNDATRRDLLLSALLGAALLPARADAQSPASQPAPAPAPPPGQRAPLLLEGKTTLYQRVIARPGAQVSPRPDPAGAKPVPGFSIYYVYAKPAGWIEVGPAADGRTIGFLAAAQAIEWKHTLVGAFTNNAGRQPVLFLDTDHNERELMLDDHAGEAAERLRRDALAGNPGPVVAVEPSGQFVDIDHNFYLLPILSGQIVERDAGPPLRLLEVISAPAEAPPHPDASKDALRNYRAGLVFLMDTTMSMEPYIERTRDAIRGFVTTLGQTAVRDNFRFGLVAYRDSLEDTLGLEYATKVYARPDFSQPPDAVLPAIAAVRDSPVSSTGFDEDPIGGLKTALDEIDWGSLAGKFIVLVTDAGARPATHPHSLTHLGITEIRQEAAAKGVQVFVIHLLTAEGARAHDHELAHAQYTELSRSISGTGSLYLPVVDGSQDGFSRAVNDLTAALLESVAQATHVPVQDLRMPARHGPESADSARLHAQVRVVGEAMRLAYLGRIEPTRPPDIVHGWTTDRDLANPEIVSLDVRVLLTRNQLSDLAAALQTILRAGLAGRTQPETFLTQLRSAFALTVRDPQRITQATRIGQLLGEYLDDLPYKSEIMNIDEDSWIAMGPIAQRKVLNDVESRLALYADFERQPDLWQDITHSGVDGEKVFPVPIEALP